MSKFLNFKSFEEFEDLVGEAFKEARRRGYIKEYDINLEQMKKLTHAYLALKEIINPEYGEVKIVDIYTQSEDVSIKIKTSVFCLFDDNLQQFLDVCQDTFLMSISSSGENEISIYITIPDVYIYE